MGCTRRGVVLAGAALFLVGLQPGCGDPATVPRQDGSGPPLPDVETVDHADIDDTRGPNGDAHTPNELGDFGRGDVPAGCGAGAYECGTWVVEGELLHCGVCPQGSFCSGEGKCGTTPDCTQDQLRVTELLLGGNFNALDVPSVGPVQPGTPVPFVIGWSAASSDDCPGCERELSVGVEGEFAACLPAGVLAPCPGMSPRHAVGVLVVPLEPGTYPLVAELAPESGCAVGGYEPGAQPTAQVVGSLMVGAPCSPKSCKDLDADCGLLDDGCGGKTWCGACTMGQSCSNDGKCGAATECALDVLEVDDVFINGFSNSAQVAAGEPVQLMFSYLFGSQESLEGEPRQIVLGVGDAPAACIDAGVPPACPSTAPGLASAKFDAPVFGGTFSVNLVATAKDDCSQATAAYAQSTPKSAIGTLTVVGGCVPATCPVLGADCGFVSDGCGGHVSCGGCPEGQVCHLGAICGPPDCQNGLFHVEEAQVGGQETAASTLPGSSVPIALTFTTGGGTECPGCPVQLVLGFPENATACFDLGTTPTCPQSSPKSVGTFILAPDLPGEHVLLAATLQEPGCPEASAAFEADVWQKAGVPIGTVTVEGTCLPAAGCFAMGKGCGNWGDGCGGIVHCGDCEEGTVCTSQGQCVSPCEEGIFEVTGTDVAGSGPVGSAPAGKAVPLAIDWELGNPDDCPACKRQVVLGVDEEAQLCVDAGVPAACPEVSSGSKTGTIVAPEKAGMHSVFALAASAPDCTAAKQQYAGDPDRKAVGTLYSVVGCTPQSCMQQGRSCGTALDGCGNSLDCGQCEPGLLCTAAGKCGCVGIDPYEPNNTPQAAFHLGDFTDKDSDSSLHVGAALEPSDEDWYSVGASDVPWAFMEPFVQVEFGLPQSFEVYVVYVCLDQTTPEEFTLINGSMCFEKESLDVEIPGVSGPVSGFKCLAGGLLGMPLMIQFGPKCSGFNDSGTLYVGVRQTGQCLAYEMDIHL